MVNVRDFGATGDGATDDRAAIQAALDAGVAGDVFVPDGNYLVGVGGGFWCLNIPAGTTLRGESQAGAVLVQAPGLPGSVRLLQCQAPSITISTLTLDGDKPGQTADEHRAGVFATAAPGLTIRDVTAQNFTGDGFYIYNHSDNATVERCTAISNDRNGITFGGGTSAAIVTGSRFAGNKAQQFDSEPGAGGMVNGIEIAGCVMDGAGASNDYALTISGSSSTVRSSNWKVHDNVINGSINVVWADDVEIRDNQGINPTTKPAVTLWRTTFRVSVVGNRWTMTQNTIDSVPVIYVAGTGVGSVSSRAYISGNELRVLNRAKSFAIRAEGFRDAIIEDNLMVGPGLAGGFPGIWLRTTIVGEDVRSAVVRRNRIYDWGALGLTISGNGAAVMRLLDVESNIFDDATATMPAAMSLDDGTGCARDVRQAGNIMLGGVATLVSRAPQGVWSAWGSGDRWLKP